MGGGVWGSTYLTTSVELVIRTATDVSTTENQIMMCYYMWRYMRYTITQCLLSEIASSRLQPGRGRWCHVELTTCLLYNIPKASQWFGEMILDVLVILTTCLLYNITIALTWSGGFMPCRTNCMPPIQYYHSLTLSEEMMLEVLVILTT